MRLMLTLRNTPEARAAYRDALRDPSEFLPRLARALGLREPLFWEGPVRLADLPSLLGAYTDLPRCEPSVGGLPPAPEPSPTDELIPRLVVVVEFDDRESAEAWARLVRGAGCAARVGADVPIAASRPNHWSPEGDLPALFHTREAAMRLLDAAALAAAGLRGQEVNVVLLDHGLNATALRAFVPGSRVAGGWRVSARGIPVWHGGPLPGRVAPNGHGTMVARNVLSLAPRARLFDLPLLPPERITNVLGFASRAYAALLRVFADITFSLSRRFPGPWVLCNAWGVLDRRYEVPGPGDWLRYTESPLHPLNVAFALAGLFGGHDVVFAAGNSGQFGPDWRAGPGDVGPGRSVLGFNSSPFALTAGAVRADGMWIGYSSQGPGQPAFAPLSAHCAKPDLCAPSHFVEPGDGAYLSSGTSAACGLAAGAVAALRSAGSDLRDVPPGSLRALLRRSARPVPGAARPWDRQVGAGILDLGRALGASPPPTS